MLLNGLKFLIVAYFLLTEISGKSDIQKIISPPKPPMYGVYEVTNFLINNDTVKAFDKRWKFIDMRFTGTLGYERFDGSRKYNSSSLDTVNQKIAQISRTDSTKVFYVLDYKRVEDSKYIFRTIIDNDTIVAETKRKLEKDYFLISRSSEFHWIRDKRLFR